MAKKILFLWLGLFFVLLSSAQITKATLQASGLTCALCAKAVYKNLSSLPFVDSVNTDLNASAFVLVFKKTAPVDLDELSKKVQDAGFSVGSLLFTIKLNDVKIENDIHETINGNVYQFINVKTQVLSGDVVFRLIDKNFVSAKDFKKFSSMTKLLCMKSGTSQSCCYKAGIKEHTRIFHVTM
jgi:copper chaperone CopZ